LEGARPGPIINPVRQVNHVWSASVGQGSYRTGYRSPMLEPKGNCSPVSKEPGGFGWQEGARLRQLEPGRRQLASHPQSPAGLRPRGFPFGRSATTLANTGIVAGSPPQNVQLDDTPLCCLRTSYRHRTVAGHYQRLAVCPAADSVPSAGSQPCGQVEPCGH